MTVPKLLKEVAGKEWVTFFRGAGEGGGYNFHIKNTLKSVIFNNKKSLY